jgi:hypothetical protein
MIQYRAIRKFKGAFTIRRFDLFCYDRAGVPQNSFYKHHREINNTSDLKAAVAVDHVAAAYMVFRRL